jgi:uncharacterized membrane protein YdfJ with MMPL/SSD domain
MARFLHWLGALVARRAWIVLAVWLVAAAGLVVLVRQVGANTSDNLDLPGTDSQAATDLLAAKFPPEQNGSSPLVFHAERGKITDARNKQAIQASHKAVLRLPQVASATDPFSQEGSAQISSDEQTAFIPVLLDVGGDDLTEEIAESVLAAGDPGRQAGMEVAVGGPVGTELSEPKTESSEVIGLVAAMIILAFTFGSLVAMGLPIVSAVIGLLAGLSVIGLLGHLVNVPTIGPTLATMIGLGVGIDYALLLVSRHRQQLRDGAAVHDSIARAVATSGSAIVFAGTTVVIALVALVVAGIPLVTSLGYSAAFAVVTAALAAITLLPAVLAIVGSHIGSLRLPAFMRPAPKPVDRGFWGWWARGVTNRPWRAIAASFALLVPLMIPFFSLDLGQEDVGAAPKSTTERQAYDLIAAGFGVGFNGPLLVATELGSPAQPSSEFENKMAKAKQLQQELKEEQKEGRQKQKQLTAKANALEQKQNELERQKADLEQQADGLSAERGQLASSRDALAGEQASVTGAFQAAGAEARGLAAEAARLTREGRAIARRLLRVQVEQRRIEARLRRDPPPPVRAALEARLRLLEREEDRLRQALERVRKQQQALRKQSQALAGEFQGLRDDESALAQGAVALGDDAVALARSAADLAQQEQRLEEQASNLQVQAANLKTQKVRLKSMQQQAKSQEQEAKQLQNELTKQLTAAGGDERGTDPRLVALQQALEGTNGVELVSPPQIDDAGDAAVFTVIASTAPAAPETATLVETLRVYVIPQATSGTDVTAFVGGQTASYVDLATAISDRLLLVIFVVIALGFLVLLAAYRSLIVSSQAALANALSVCAAFGVLTACFQWGWGLSLVGLDTASGTVPIASYVPLIMFAVLFGLSMDYQVFLISQISHQRAQGKDYREEIAYGLASGARVITAAALIMMSVFGSFVLNGDPTVKQFGVGLAVGVALAALSVLLLAPALLVLAGPAAWWLPGWVDRTLPHIDIEGAGARPGVASSARPGALTAANAPQAAGRSRITVWTELSRASSRTDLRRAATGRSR